MSSPSADAAAPHRAAFRPFPLIGRVPRSTLALLAVSILLPLLLFGLAAWQNRCDVALAAEHRVERTTRILHEHALKVFETHQLMLDRSTSTSNDRLVEAGRGRRPAQAARASQRAAAAGRQRVHHRCRRQRARRQRAQARRDGAQPRRPRLFPGAEDGAVAPAVRVARRHGPAQRHADLHHGAAREERPAGRLRRHRRGFHRAELLQGVLQPGRARICPHGDPGAHRRQRARLRADAAGNGDAAARHVPGPNSTDAAATPSCARR